MSYRASATTIKEMGAARILYRSRTADDEVLCEEYQRSRFFIPEYTPLDGDVILDVGAHIGVFAIQVAMHVGTGQVYAIEPGQENYSILSQNVELNNLTNVHVRRLALSDERGVAMLFYGKENWAHSLLPCDRMEDSEEVPCDTLLNFLALNEIRWVDYMKMNVEGMEYSILLNAPEPTLQRIGFTLIEFHPTDKHRLAALMRHLSRSGFRIKVTYSQSEKGKGWIVGKRINRKGSACPS